MCYILTSNVYEKQMTRSRYVKKIRTVCPPDWNKATVILMLHTVRATFCSPAFHTSWDSVPHFGWVCRTHTFLNSGSYSVHMKGRLLITVKRSKPSIVVPISENYKLPQVTNLILMNIVENTTEKTKQQLNCVCHNRLKTAEKKCIPICGSLQKLKDCYWTEQKLN